MVEVIKKHFSLLCELRKRYRFEFLADHVDNDSVINYKLGERAETNPYLEFLMDELAVFPVDVIDKLHLDRIIVCKDLKKHDQDVSGCASMSLFPDNLASRLLFRKNTIYLDIEYSGTAEGKVTVHHELFHAIEAHEDRFPKYLDPDWPKLNPVTFSYREELGGNRTKIHHGYVEGFLSDYSMDAVREDKAELFSHMIVNYAKVEEFMAKDKHIKAKVARMKDLLRTFSSDFNEKFWTSRRDASRKVNSAEYNALLMPRWKTTLFT